MEGKPVPSKTAQIPALSATQIAEEVLNTPSPSKTAQSATRMVEEITEQSGKSERHKKHRKLRRVRKWNKEDLLPTDMIDIKGVKKITISPLAQKLVKCLVGEDLTSENPWRYVYKEALEENLELHEESSEFLPIKQEILVYPREEILVIYIPEESGESNDFYICLTEKAETTVLEIITNIQQEREERLNNSIWKTVRPWKTLGSEVEVEEQQTKNNRPLLEVEVESEYPIMQAKTEFRLRLVKDARDGYRETLCARQTFANVHRRRKHVGVQVAPFVVENESQTVYPYPKNVFTVYEFEYPKVKSISKELRKNMESFLTNEMDRFSDMMYVNSNINFYQNDYLNLVRDKRYTFAPQMTHVKPYTSFVDPNICKGKEIVCLSWHPMWTGTVAIAYADYKLNDSRKVDLNEDEVTKAMYDTIPVLLWSFQDNLNPKLLLETPREITQLSWCPYDENVLIGGCVNGQIIVWDVSDKLKGVEEEEILTVAHINYRIQMNSLMTWMKNTKDLKVVRATAVSDLEYSQRNTITAIRWVSPYREVTKSGQIKEIPEEENRTSLQFMTSSTDGTVTCWDLLAKPVSYSTLYRPQRKLRRLKKRPSALTMDVSPYRVLHRLFKPLFKVIVLSPDASHHLPISEMNVRITSVDYEERYPNPKRKFNVADRILYKPIFIRPVHPLVNQFVAGTTEGDFLIASWEGFDYNSGEVVNKETCKFENFGKYHDGPIVAISRSEAFPDLILMAGGRIFSLWKTDFKGRPIFWRRCRVRYTHGSWNMFRPSIFRLSREDGYIEMWHLKTRSDQYTDISFISGGGLGSSTTHPRIMKQNIIGMVEAKGVFELFLVARSLSPTNEEEKWSTYKICLREVERKRKFLKWQDEWVHKHADEIKAKQEQEFRKQQEKEQELNREKAQMKADAEELQREIDKALAHTGPEPGHYAEWAREQLAIREQQRMLKELMQKKHLDMNVLLKQQIPLIKWEQEEEAKRVKQEARRNNALKLFQDTVAMQFPDSLEKKPPPPVDPYAGGDSTDVKVHLFENYLETSEECEEYIKNKQYFHKFNWLRLLETGKERRKILDGYYSRYNHKLRIKKEKERKKKETGQSEVISLVESQTSLGSIDYEVFSDEVVDSEQDNVESQD